MKLVRTKFLPPLDWIGWQRCVSSVSNWMSQSMGKVNGFSGFQFFCSFFLREWTRENGWKWRRKPNTMMSTTTESFNGMERIGMDWRSIASQDIQTKRWQSERKDTHTHTQWIWEIVHSSSAIAWRSAFKKILLFRLRKLKFWEQRSRL